MADNKQLQGASNGLVLMGSGVAVLLFKGLFLNPVSRVILAAIAGGWGIYTLITNPRNRDAGWISIGAAAGLLVFGGLLTGISTIAGIGLIIAGAVSSVTRLLKGSSRDQIEY